MPDDKHISRRSFIKAAGAALGLSALGYLLTRKAAVSSPPAAALSTALINPTQPATASGPAAGRVSPVYMLPRNLLTAPGSVFEDFEDFAGFSAHGSGAIAANTTQFRSGTKSLKITSPAGGTETVTKTINWDPGGSAPARMRVYFYYHNADAADLTYLRLYVSSDTNPAAISWHAAKAPETSGIRQGWNCWDIYPADWDQIGAESWSNTIIRLRFVISAPAGKVVEISLDEIELNPTMSAACMLTFDDGWDTVYSTGYRYMHSKGLNGTFYVISDYIDGGGGKITSAMLTEMSAGGWSIGNHTKSHTVLSRTDLAGQTAALADCTAALNALGLTKASMHCAYPNGAYNSTTLLADAAAGILSARATSANYPTCMADQNLFYPSAMTFDDTVSLAQAKAGVDLAVSTGRIICFYGHKFAASAAIDTWAISDFQALVDYIVANNLPCLTISDYYAAQTGPISISK